MDVIGPKAGQRLRALHLAAFPLLLLLRTTVSGQMGPLPLEEGNYWVYDRVLGEDRAPAAGRITVHAPLRVKVVESDSNYWNDAQEAYGDSGELYYRVSIEGLRLFPDFQPDTLFVRADSLGNAWCGGYVRAAANLARVSAEDDPWLLADGPWDWTLRLTRLGSHVTYYRSQWVEPDISTEEGERWVSSDPPYTSWSTGNGYLVGIARRYVPDLTPQSSNKLLRILATSTGSTTTSLDPPGFVIVTGIGIVYVAIATDQTELQGVHMELSEAKIGGRRLRIPAGTSVDEYGWAEVKLRSEKVGVGSHN